MNHKSRQGQLTRLLFKRVKASNNARRSEARGNPQRANYWNSVWIKHYRKWHRLNQQ